MHLGQCVVQYEKVHGRAGCRAGKGSVNDSLGEWDRLRAPLQTCGVCRTNLSNECDVPRHCPGGTCLYRQGERGRKEENGIKRTDDGVNKAQNETLCSPVDDEIARHVVVVKRYLVLVGKCEMNAAKTETSTGASETRVAHAGD